MVKDQIDCTSSEVVLIITGCISPILNQNSLVLKDIGERYRQYVESIKYYIKESIFYNIIFCDNSGYDAADQEALCNLALAKGKRFEWLSFRGDLERSASISNKGLGEDEIMDYVFSNSSMAQASRSFVKITGRLLLLNNRELMLSACYGKNYFYRDMYGRVNHGVDTRFFVMDTSFYLNHVRKCFDRVNDYTIRYEDAVCILLEGRYNLLDSFPKIHGKSSGNGHDYSKEGAIKLCFLNFLCRHKLFDKHFTLINNYYLAIHKIREIIHYPYY